MLSFGPDPESCGTVEILLPTAAVCGIVGPNIQEVYPVGVLVVEPAHVCTGTAGVDHDGDAVQLVMPGMKDVPHLDGGSAVLVERRG
jgi:hypothetical protein